jgi:AcrR family transcriptional regulator
MEFTVRKCRRIAKGELMVLPQTRGKTKRSNGRGGKGAVVPRAQLTPESWIHAAIELLAERGIDAVRVDVLAKILRVTRGSFYWHFADRADLLRAVLGAWRDTATEQVTERFERRGVTPEELVKELLSLPFHGRAAALAARIELGIRAWARRDPMARQAVDEADARRISYVAQLFSSLGFGIAEARARAFILYAHTVGESVLHQQGTAAQKAERTALIEQLVMCRLPDPEAARQKSSRSK